MVHRLLVLLAFAALVIAAPLRAQQRGQDAPPRITTSTAPPPPVRPADADRPNGNNHDADVAGQIMQLNGGSLLKATMSAAPDPQQVALSKVSFFAVPPPEPRVIRKHDLVTIIVRQESEYSSDGKTETKKEATLDAALEQFIRLHMQGNNLKLTGDAIGATPLAISANGKREFKSEGKVERDDSFVTRVQARVVDVKPNDTLVLEARSEITHDEEFQRLILSGTCRAEDISADNSILSTQLYDLSLKKQSRGNVRNATKKGFLPKLLDAINPF